MGLAWRNGKSETIVKGCGGQKSTHERITTWWQKWAFFEITKEEGRGQGWSDLHNKFWLSFVYAESKLLHSQLSQALPLWIYISWISDHFCLHRKRFIEFTTVRTTKKCPSTFTWAKGQRTGGGCLGATHFMTLLSTPECCVWVDDVPKTFSYLQLHANLYSWRCVIWYSCYHEHCTETFHVV